MLDALRRRTIAFWATAASVAATAVALRVVRPFTVGPIGPDAAAPVIEFERLLAGQHLEGYLSQTSKPLLTAVYGLAWVTTEDWRAVSLLAIASYVLLVAVAVALAYRLGGPAAAGFAAAGIALSPQLLIDVTFAYGVSWAMLGCGIAALAVLADRPRFGAAGTALALAALARPEVLAVTALSLAAIVIGHAAARTGRVASPPPGVWLLALGLVAIPALCAHDWALTGDPLFWANTAAANSLGHGHLESFVGILRYVGRHVLSAGPLLVLAALAMLDLAARRRWTAAIAVSIAPVAVTAFFIASGARGTVITDRYLRPIDLALVWAAAVGLGGLDVPRVRGWLRRVPLTLAGPASVLVPMAVGAVLAVGIAPSWPRDADAHATVATQREKAANAARAFAAIGHAIVDVPSWRAQLAPAEARTLVFLPARLRAQGIVDLDLPLWAGTKLTPLLVDPQRGLPEPGTIVYHDRLDDPRSPVWASVEVDRPTVIGGLRLVPVFVDARAGIWVVRVEAASTGSP